MPEPPLFPRNAPPGTLRDRVEASIVIYARSVQWLTSNPGETLDGFTAWLQSRQWQDSQYEWTQVLQYDAEMLGRLIWKMFEMLQ